MPFTTFAVVNPHAGGQATGVQQAMSFAVFSIWQIPNPSFPKRVS